MRLEWYRQHKKFVYWILLPVMVVTMGIFGASSALQTAGSHGGPSATYKVGDTWHYMSPSEVLNARYVLNQYNPPPNRYVSSVEAAFHQVAWRAAALAGFELGDEEFKERLLQDIKNRTQQPDVSEKLYQKLLQTIQLTPVQFEGTTREMGMRQKMFEYLREQSIVDDKELFVAYAREKEVVRLRYKEFKSEDFVDKTKEPAEDKIKEFYDGNKENAKELKDVMFTKPKLSADMLYLDTEKLFGGDVKPTDDELKKCYEKNKGMWPEGPKPGEPAPAAGAVKYKPLDEVKAAVEARWKEEEVQGYYDRYKRFYWQAPLKPGETAPPVGEEKYKPFAEVKDEVEKKWKNEQLAQRGQRRLQRLGEQVTEAEKAWAKAQEGKPEADRKPFDLADWAKKENLVYWATEELTEDQYKAGKREVGAKDAAWGNLFYLMQDFPRMNEAQRKRQKERQKEFAYPQPTDKGVVMARVRKHVTEEVKPLAEAREAITKRLRIFDAADLAKEAATKVHDEWAEGKNLPAVDTLDEARGDQSSRSPLVREFFKAPKAIGEVLDVADGPADENNPASTDPNRHFFVGFAVERDLPTWDGFNHDTSWSRDDKRKELAMSDYYSVATTLVRQMQDMGKRLGTMSDPPLFEDRRRGGRPVEDDE